LRSEKHSDYSLLTANHSPVTTTSLRNLISASGYHILIGEMRKEPLILLTNDDGYEAKGLRIAREHLSRIGQVVVVAPDKERSATSHSLTVHRPLRQHRVEKNLYIVDGTPTDCVMVAVHAILKRKPNVLVSGINHGPNVGDDVTYSGTIAAAMEGTLLGIPSIAVSQANWMKSDFKLAAKFTARIVPLVIENGLPPETLLNINVPSSARAQIDNYSLTRLGKRVFNDVIHEKLDPRGRKYFWIGGSPQILSQGKGTDLGALRKGLISITPLHLDLTNYKALEEIGGWLKP